MTTTTSRSSSQAGSVMRGVFLFLLIALMILLVFLTLRSLFFFPTSRDDTSPTSSTAAAAPAGPIVVVPLDGGDSATGGVSCGRRIDATADDPFLVQIDDPATSSENIVVAVALVSADGSRSPRQVTVAGTGDDQVRQAAISDSGDSLQYVSCVVTAIQRNDQVILTGL